MFVLEKVVGQLLPRSSSRNVYALCAIKVFLFVCILDVFNILYKLLT